MRRLVMLYLVFMFLMPTSALAQENSTNDTTNDTVSEEEAGIAPDSFLYIFDRLFEKLELALALSEEAKVKVRLKHAEERLAEIKLMQKKNKTKVIVKLSDEYQKEIEEVEKEIEEAEKKGKNVTEIKVKAVEATAKHQEVLQWVYQLVPPEAKPAIEHALNVSRRGHEKIKMKFETNAGELKIKMGKKGIEVELKNKIPKEERAKAGKQKDGHDEEGKIKAEVKGNITKVEVELSGAEYKLTLNTTQRDEIIAEIANITGLTPNEVAQLLELEVEKEEHKPKTKMKTEVEVEEEESETKVEIEVEVKKKEEESEEVEEEEEKEEEHKVEVEIERGGAEKGKKGRGR